MDCYIVANKFFRELRKLDLHGKTTEVLLDAFSRHCRVNIDLEPDDIMFNSSVMLIDLEKRYGDKPCRIDAGVWQAMDESLL